MNTDYENHFAEAKRMYGMSWEDDRTEEESTLLIARAQVHATLALAAAAHGTTQRPEGRRENVFEFAERVAKEADQTPEDSASSDGSMTLAVRMKDND
jgi:hypothetical protein